MIENITLIADNEAANVDSINTRLEKANTNFNDLNSTKADITYLNTKLTEQQTYIDTSKNYTLTHTKVGTVHTLTSLPTGQGIYQCQFIATADYTEGNTFKGYTAKPTGEETILPDKAFVKGDIVSITVDTVNKKLGITAGGRGLTRSFILVGNTNGGAKASEVDFLCNGVNDTKILQSAMDEAYKRHTFVYILEGTYSTGELRPKVSLIGEGVDAVRFNMDVSSRRGVWVFTDEVTITGIHFFTNDTSTIQFDFIRLEANNIKFSGNIVEADYNSDGESIDCEGGTANTQVKYSNLEITNNLLIGGRQFFDVRNVRNLKISNNRLENCISVGCLYDNISTEFINNFAADNVRNSLYVGIVGFKQIEGVLIKDNIFKSASLRIDTAKNTVVNSNVFTYLRLIDSINTRIMGNIYNDSINLTNVSGTINVNNLKVSNL